MRGAFDPLQQARRQLLECGTVASGALGERLTRSWQRSLHAGLQPLSRGPAPEPIEGPAFHRVLQRNEQLLAYARPVMDYLYGQIQGSHCMLVLADAHSTLLHTLGDDAFLDKAQRVALRCGASWDERERGTNAIGTAVAERAALQVRGAEHFLEQNGFLHCSATPIFTAQGEVAGAIDISGDRYASQRHAMGLVHGAARMIENNWLKARYPQHLRLHLHAQAEGLDTPAEGIVVLTLGGVLVGANPEGMRLLNLAPADFSALRLEGRLQQRLSRLLSLAGQAPQALELPDGRRLHMRVQAPAATVVACAPSRAAPPPARDALAERDTGDAQWHAATQKVRRILDKPIPLLVLGESGVGKEVFARACHDSGPRQSKPFVAINCAAIPESLIEAELFGYAPGAYTGAQRGGSPGRIREAEGGTLFLDEIGHMPLLLQTRLLRVLQERKVVPLGGAPVAVDFALMSATHRPLAQAVADGSFRGDLYYRINGFSVHLPPLRERTDFAALAAAIVHEAAGTPCPIAPDLLAAFQRYAWPGNLRQLTSALHTACALREPHETCIGWQHLADDLRLALQEPAQPPQAAGMLKELSRHALHAALRDTGGNVSAAARRLGISRQTIYRHLRSEG
ncbi:sigma-54-dependent Fis family transcriptional regulator [Acidovorax sp. MR-S7]|uniref:sigma-54-dependent Fis family transcriptional regulator n=1 Tax=Acidovorax sp. MR-S7 TaxID=1268622 RepID=UPI0003A6CC67|nr:sigma-54-dependent Fis family transcriptional regulator [Acidovorax sp. MR-S7]